MEKTLNASSLAKRQLSIGTLALFLLVVFAAVIGVPAYGYYVGYSWVDWVTFGVLYVVTGLGITVGYHRLVSHSSFSCPNGVKVALLIAGGWALENTALKWASAHIRHHKRNDQDDDPYNAQRGFWFSHCIWVVLKDPYRKDDEKYGANLRKDSIVMWQYRWYVPIVLSGLLLPFVIGYLHSGWRGATGCFMLAGVGRVFLVLNSTFCINSVCHLWGKQPYDTRNSSRDSWWVSLLTFGEGYHNYHHANPRDYRNGPLWYNFDPSKWLIYSLFRVGLASNLFREENPGRRTA